MLGEAPTPAAPIAAAASAGEQALSSGYRRSPRMKYLFILPGVLWVLAFGLFPLFYALRMSLYSYRLGGTERFIGFGNFARAVGDERLLQALGITVRFALVSVVATVSIGLILALFFNRPIRGMPVFRTILTLPLFVPAVAIGYLTLTIVHQDGPVNHILFLFGVPRPLPFLSDPFWAFVTIAAVDVWQWTPFAFVVLLAGLQSLPEEIYEAAALDTSSSWQTFRHITLPLLMPVIVTVAILRTVEAAKVVDIPFIVTAGGPGTATRTYTMYTYISGMVHYDFGYGTAIALIFVVLLIIPSGLFFWRARRLYE